MTPTELIRGIQRDMTRLATWKRLAQGEVAECEGILSTWSTRSSWPR